MRGKSSRRWPWDSTRTVSGKPGVIQVRSWLSLRTLFPHTLVSRHMRRPARCSSPRRSICMKPPYCSSRVEQIGRLVFLEEGSEDSLRTWTKENHPPMSMMLGLMRRRCVLPDGSGPIDVD